eukprot:gene26175-32072_t
MEPQEPVLLVPPRLTSIVLGYLSDSGLVARHWHLGGRYGSRVSAQGPLRAIPLLPATADRLSVALYTRGLLDGDEVDAQGDEVDAQGDLPPLPTPLWDALRTGEAKLGRVKVAVPSKVPKVEEVDSEVHAERAPRAAPVTAVLPPPRGAFTYAELFAGIGGFALGLDALGGRCVFASEIAPTCVDVYKRNFPDGPEVAGDIWDVKEADIPPHDLLVGGFPCQPFSSLGEQPGLADTKGSGEGRGMLFTQIVRVLKACRPSAFLLENVPGLLHLDEGRPLATIVAALAGAGYAVRCELLNARCVSAQSRNRLYLVGLRRELPSPLAQCGAAPSENGPEAEARESVEESGISSGVCYLSGGSLSASQASAGSDARGTREPEFEFPWIPDLRLRTSHVLQNEAELALAAVSAAQYSVTDAQLAKLLEGKLWKPSKMAWGNKVSATLDAHYSVAVGRGDTQLVPRPPPFHPRRFTPRECARLMGFPDRFTLGERRRGQGVNAWFKEQYTMLGNAVCPQVVAALAGAILAHCPGIPGFEHCADWAAMGRSSAVRLAVDAVAPACRAELLRALHPSFATLAADLSASLT